MASCCQPERVSMKTAPGRLMQISVIDGFLRNPRSGSSISVNAVSRPPSTGRPQASVSRLCGTTKLVHAAEVHIAGHQDLDAIAIALDDRGRNAERVLEHLACHILRTARAVDDGAAATAAGLHCGLYGPIERGDQDRSTKSLPEMSLDLTWQSGATQLIRTGGVQRHQHPGWRERFSPQHEHS